MSGRPLRISAHAVNRWQQRVEPAATQLEARLALGQLVRLGQARSRPRHWTDVDPAPGLIFIYWVNMPQVCALAKDGTVVTVVTRELCAKSRAPRETLRALAGRTPRYRLHPAPAWRWDGIGEAL